MYWKLIDDNSREIICRPTIWSAIEPGITNLQVDHVEPIPEEKTNDTDDDIINDILRAADFGSPILCIIDHTVSIPESVESKTWQEN